MGYDNRGGGEKGGGKDDEGERWMSMRQPVDASKRRRLGRVASRVV